MGLRLDSIRIRPRLLGGFALVSTLVLAGGLLISSGAQNARKVVEYQKTEIAPANAVIVSLDEAETAVRRGERSLVKAGINEYSGNQALQTMSEAWKRIEDVCATYDSAKKSNEQEQAWSETKQRLAAWRPLNDQVVSLAKAGKLTKARALCQGSSADAYWSAGDSLDALTRVNAKAKAQSDTQLNETVNSMGREAIMIVLAVILVGLTLGTWIARSIYLPLQRLGEAFGQLAEGNVDVSIDTSGRDEIGDLARSAHEMAEEVKGIVENTNSLAEGGKNGIFEKRVETTGLEGAYLELATNMNALMESIAEPLSVMKAAVDRMSENDFTTTIDQDFPGVWDELKTSMVTHAQRMNHAIKVIARMSQGDISELEMLKTSPQRCQYDELKPAVINTMQTIKELSDDIDMLVKAATEGKLDVRADSSRHGGAFKEIVDGVNRTLDAVIEPLNMAADYVDRIAKGDTPPKITDEYKGDYNTIKNNLNTCIEQIGILVDETGVVIQAAKHGRLSERCNADRTGGVYRKLLRGLNDTLDSVIGPLNMAADYVDRIGRGDIPERVTDAYNGDFNTIKNNLNKCIDGLGGMVEANAVLQQMALNDYRQQIEGDYEGIYAELKEAVNLVHSRLTHVVESLARMAAGDLSELEKIRQMNNGLGRRGDHDQLTPSFVSLMENLRSLVDDSSMLSQAAVQGKLDVRADASVHQGSFRETIEGMNSTLEAVAQPIDEAAKVLGKLADNDLTARMEGDYNGELATIKNSLNSALDTLGEAIREVAGAAEQVASSAHTLHTTANEVGKGAEQIAETITQVAAGSGEQSRVVQSSAAGMEQLQKSIQEVALGTQNQAQMVDETVGLVQEISSAIEQVAKSAQDAATTSEQVSEVATEGGQQVAEAVNSMDRIKEATDKVAEMVGKLGESSQQIGAIVETIDDIAEQTNLLALNAAIEAARAGEHGKGFAVVADEVRKLAERSSKATGEIAELIGGIRQMTEEAVNAMERGAREVADGTELGNQAGIALRRIQDAVGNVVKQVEEVSAASQQMANSSTEVIRAIEGVSAITEESTAATEEMAAASSEVSRDIDQVAAVSQENAASAEEVSATAEEQSAAVEEMTSASEELSGMATDLRELVSQFKIRDTSSDIQNYRKAA